MDIKCAIAHPDSADGRGVPPDAAQCPLPAARFPLRALVPAMAAAPASMTFPTGERFRRGATEHAAQWPVRSLACVCAAARRVRSSDLFIRSDAALAAARLHGA